MSKKDKVTTDASSGIFGGAGLWAGQQGEQTTQMVRSPRGRDAQMLAGFKQAGRQLGLFDELEEATQGRVRDLQIKDTELYVGIDLDGDGWELFETIQTVLHLHSQTSNQDAPDYYKGDPNDTEFKVAIWNGKKEPVAYIKTNLAELTKIRTGIDKPHGSDIDTTARLIQKYNQKPYCVRYKEYYTETKNVRGRETTRTSYRTIETADALYKAVVKRDHGTRTSSVQFWLLPLFFHQIATNYNSRPLDYISRVRRAYITLAGKTRTKTPDSLHYFLTRLVEAQNNEERSYHCKLFGEGGLYTMIDERATKKRMWKQLEATLCLFADVAKEIGLLESWETKKSVNNDNTVATFKVVPQGQWH